MKVVRRDVDGDGKVWLNPYNLPKIMAGSIRQCSSAILTPTELVASTIPCSSHDDIAAWAGSVDDDIDWWNPVAGQGRLRGWMNENEVTFEFWYHADQDPQGREIDYMEEPPVTADQLQKVIDWALSHPKMRAAYPKGIPAPVISLWADGEIIWEFAEGRLNRLLPIKEADVSKSYVVPCT